MKIPALGQPGEICWVGVRNPIENPDHATGDPKYRPAILIRPSNDGWLVIGTTSHRIFANGEARQRIPVELWEAMFPSLPRRAGYFWGTKATWVVTSDVGDHIGWAPPELRALAVRDLANVTRSERNDFLRLRPEELADRSRVAATTDTIDQGSRAPSVIETESTPELGPTSGSRDDATPARIPCDTSPVPIGSKEAALDLLLAEEFANNPALCDYVARPAFLEAGRRLPEGEPSHVRVRFNVWHQVDDGNHGENDLDVQFEWHDGTTLRLLVEDKVWAPLQPSQAERYLARAEACGGAAVLVAPRAWVVANAAAAELFHGNHAIEDIAALLLEQGQGRLDAARVQWRAQLLLALAEPRERSTPLDHAPTIAFRDYCVEWLAKHGSSAEPSLTTLHTAGQGWLWFSHPKDLGFKASSGNIDLYVASNGFEGDADGLRAALSAHPLPAGFEVATDTSIRRNLVLRLTCPRFATGAGVPDDPTELDEALNACLRITAWFDDGGANALNRTGASQL